MTKPEKVTTTSVTTEVNEADYASSPTLNTQVENFRRAFAIAGMLIAAHYINVDFDDRAWADNFEALVLDTADILNLTSFSG